MGVFGVVYEGRSKKNVNLSMKFLCVFIVDYMTQS